MYRMRSFALTLLTLAKQLKTYQSQNLLLRSYVTLLSKEFDASQFCTVNIKCPYNINIEPIDVFESQEKVFIKLDGNDDVTKLPEAKCEKVNDTINIDISGASEKAGDFTLNVDTSVKANLCINGHNGNINIGSFYGRFIKARSENGNISLSKSQCEEISLTTNNGSITCDGVVQAGKIELLIRNAGEIFTDRLQGLTLIASTKNGSITIGSSYCDNSTFAIETGQLILQNLHKHVEINIEKEGLLNIVGFDGDLTLNMKKGLADIQFAKITKDSKIFAEEPSSLILRLSDECQQSNIVWISTDNLLLSDDVKMNCELSNKSCTLLPRNGKEYLNKLEVQCENSHVSVNSTSWAELMKSSLKMKT